MRGIGDQLHSFQVLDTVNGDTRILRSKNTISSMISSCSPNHPLSNSNTRSRPQPHTANTQPPHKSHTPAKPINSTTQTTLPEMCIYDHTGTSYLGCGHFTHPMPTLIVRQHGSKDKPGSSCRPPYDFVPHKCPWCVELDKREEDQRAARAASDKLRRQA